MSPLSTFLTSSIESRLGSSLTNSRLVPGAMGYAGNGFRGHSLSTRARSETYAGLLLLLLGLTVLTFRPCPVSTPGNHRIIGDHLRTGGKGLLPHSIGYGSAPEDGRLHKGWWMGHFANGAAQRTNAIEAKWIKHPAGEKNEGWASNKVTTSVAMLISGRHRMEFRDSHILLENQGDYVIWGPGIEHSWTALEETVVMCIRWPSLPADQVPVAQNITDVEAATVPEVTLNIQTGNVTMKDNVL